MTEPTTVVMTPLDAGQWLIERARTFATAAHAAIDQRRKYTDDPYIVHPQRVAERVASVPHTPDMIAAAWLHDVVEDTAVTIEEIQREFGDDVAVLVAGLTDVSRLEDGNRKVRKAIDHAHSAQQSPACKTVKLADLIDNSITIRRYGKGFARIFMDEMAISLPGLKEGDPTLYAEACAIVEHWQTRPRHAKAPASDGDVGAQ
ncbi:HD domain-containing protein [Zymobacter palmae]|uniref:Metal dependent phosphohydrolase n=1 Tax=Zymobacter palmae TaxID=33074 RepID=A0A348HHH1_9GAMM|nr:HD domain-containing protein [Zymobacter palmae]BBG31073.1 metal dependent phosphohydrolase [Zymobacter palmae]